MSGIENQLVSGTGLPIGTLKLVEVDYKELATILIRAKGIREGHWAVCMNFSSLAKNVKIDQDETTVPGLLTCVTKIGINRLDEPTLMTVDAAEVNPPEGVGN